MRAIYIITNHHAVVGINAYTSREAADEAAKHFGCVGPKVEIIELYPVDETTVKSWIERDRIEQ
jgi:hypothetical protein